MIDQICEDHNNASLLANGISNINGLRVDSNNIKSNIIYFDIENGRERNRKLHNQTKDKNQYPYDIVLDNIFFLETSPNRFRFVTHYGITDKDVESTLIMLKDIVI